MQKEIHPTGPGRSLSYVVYQQDDGFVAQCLDVNVASDGDSEPQAVDNLREALELYFDGADDNGLPAVETSDPPALLPEHEQGRPDLVGRVGLEPTTDGL